MSQSSALTPSTTTLPIVAIDVVLTTKRGRCYECGCTIYIHANSYCCSFCSVATTPGNEGKEVKKEAKSGEIDSDYALICNSPVCVMKHSLRDQHTMCTCKTCAEREVKKGSRTYLVDPRCYHCNQLPGLGRSDDDIAFTIDGRGVVHRGHVWTKFSEYSRYLTWCRGEGCPSPPFNVIPARFGSDFHYSIKEWSLADGVSGAMSKNETMRRFLARSGEKICLPGCFIRTLKWGGDDNLPYRLESFRRIISGEFGPVPSDVSIAPLVAEHIRMYAEDDKDLEMLRNHANTLKAYIDVILQLPKHEQENFKSLVQCLRNRIVACSLKDL